MPAAISSATQQYNNISNLTEFFRDKVLSCGSQPPLGWDIWLNYKKNWIILQFVINMAMSSLLNNTKTYINTYTMCSRQSYQRFVLCILPQDWNCVWSVSQWLIRSQNIPYILFCLVVIYPNLLYWALSIRSHGTVVNSYDLTTYRSWIQAPNRSCPHTCDWLSSMAMIHRFVQLHINY